MLVEIIEKIRGFVTKKHMLNHVSMFISVFFLFSILNTWAAECVDIAQLPKLDPVKGYQTETAITKSSTGDTSYNSQTTTMNIVMGGSNGLLQNLAPQVLSNYEDIQANADIPSYAKGGAIGMADGAVYALMDSFEGMNVPAYLASEWVPGYQQNTSIYAAEDGYSYLQESNVDQLWDRLRLVAYVFFVVILIVAGFMIMFRQKIGGQLAVSVFNVLPNIIISLILVTFSFAIVGLMINFGVMAVNVVGSVIGVSQEEAIVVDSPFTLLKALGTGEQGVEGVKDVFQTALGLTVLSGISTIVTGPVGVALTIVFLFIAITIAAIVIYASVRVYITILVAYLTLLFNTVIAPLVLTVAAFPGQQWMISDWLKKILKSVLTFPIVFFFLNLGTFILSCEINIAFPSGFMSGDLSNVPAGVDSPIGLLFKGVAVIALFFFAADAPKIMDDFLQTNDGRGAQGAIEGVKKGLSRIPIVGSFFG